MRIQRTLIHYWWEHKRHSHFGRQSGSFHNANYTSKIQSNSCTPRYLGVEKLCSQMSWKAISTTKNLNTNVYNSFIYNLQKPKATKAERKTSFHKWMDEKKKKKKKTACGSCRQWLSFSNKKKWTTKSQKDIEESCIIPTCGILEKAKLERK